MLFWIVCAVLTAGVVLVLTRPLARAGEGARHDARAADLEVYRDQLREIETDVARGLMNEVEAAAARLEVSRRILAIEDQQPTKAKQREAAPMIGTASLAISAAVPLLALAVYIALGSPGLPGRPAAERTASTSLAGTPVGALVEQVEARLREHPEDGQGWDVIAPVYLRLERFEDAAYAFARAIALLGESAKRLSGLAEAKVMGANGVVGEDARKAFARLLELEPGRPEARFWLAMAKEQDGDLAAAAEDYKMLLAEAPEDAQWRMLVQQRLVAVSGSAAAGTGAQEQRKMIESMVAGLAERLKKDGSDVAGWQRLLQSYTVLGRKDAAAAALGQARKALEGNAKGLAEVEAFANGLGIVSKN